MTHYLEALVRNNYLVFDCRLHDLQLLVIELFPLCIIVLYGELIPSSLLN